MDTISGRCRSICPTSSSRFEPAASAITPNRPGSDSTTERHCRPIEPVEPRMANLVKDCVTNSSFPCFRGLCFSGLCFRGRVPELHARRVDQRPRSEEHTSELQSPDHLVCRLLLEKK